MVVCLLFFLVPDPNKTSFFSSDFLFHYGKSGGIEYPLISIDGTPTQPVFYDSYAPFVSFISAPFSFRIETFYLFWLMFFFLLFPLVLVGFSGKFFSGLAWFGFSAPFFFVSGLLSQGVISLFLVLFVFKRNIFLRLFLLFFSLFVHADGFFLLAGYWVFEILYFWFKYRLFFLGACFLPIAENNGSEEAVNLVSSSTGKSVFGTTGLLATNHTHVFQWFLFNPLAFFGFVGLWKKHRHLFFFCLLVMFLSWLFLYWRVVLSVVPFFAIGVGYYFDKASNMMRFLLCVLVFLGVLLLLFWFGSLLRLWGFSFLGALGCTLSFLTT